jgi:hypothetical protein
VLLAAVAGMALAVSAWFAAVHWLPLARQPAALSQADVLGLPGTGTSAGQDAAGHGPVDQGLAGQRAAMLGTAVGQQPEIVSIAVASPPIHPPGPSLAGAVPGYLDPLRAVAGLTPERIDDGVDFAGTGPIYALGDAVITNAGENYGWPGGGWITYRLTDGPGAGLMVYVAEDVTATVQVGQRVTPMTVIADMFNGGDGIETGWAQPTGASAESELAVAGGIGGYGPFPTRVGANFDELLQMLGVPAAPNAGDVAYGVLPANYPAIWR